MEALRIAQFAGVVDVLAGEAEFGGGRCWGRMFPAGTFASTASHLPPLLRRVVLIGARDCFTGPADGA
jgi:hypothetical protein